MSHLQADKNITVTNVFEPYDQINSKLALAVNAQGTVPDLSYVDTQYISYFMNNGTLTDLTDYVKAAPWYANVNPNSMKSCTGPDGKIYCVPTNVNATLNYYWTAAYPNGAPKTTDDLLTAAAAFPKGKYALTFKGSEAVASEQTYFSLIKSFGGTIADASGKVAWATPQTVNAIEFFRQVFAKRYAPQVDLATGFDDETMISNGTAGLFMAGTWSYVYLYPLVSPDGKKFDDGAGSVEQALKAGALATSAPLTAPGGQPVSILTSSAFAIPVGAKNVDAAKAVIDYIMQPLQNADFAVAYGALPSNTLSLQDNRFKNSSYWQAVEKIVEQYGTPVDPMLNYDKAVQKLSDTIVTLIQKPNMDILKTLQAAQDEINAGS